MCVTTITTINDTYAITEYTKLCKARSKTNFITVYVKHIICCISLNNAGKNAALVNHERRIIFLGRDGVNQGALPKGRGTYLPTYLPTSLARVPVVINALFHLQVAYSVYSVLGAF